MHIPLLEYRHYISPVAVPIDCLLQNNNKYNITDCQGLETTLMNDFTKTSHIIHDIVIILYQDISNIHF